MRFTSFRSFALALAFGALVVTTESARAGYVTFGSGFGSKWDDPNHGTPAIVTWGYMDDLTTLDPSHPMYAEVSGGSDISTMRADFDATYGAEAFESAIEDAFDAWELVANILFVGPMPDSGLPSGSTGATDPDIRIGAFTPVPSSGFSFVGAVGFGPPGDDLNYPDALAGDILFNIEAGFIMPSGAEDDPIMEFGNDLQNLTMHELGHAAMGLGHPSDGPGEVMYVGAGCCDFINRIPSADDITGAQIVYGEPAPEGDVDLDGDVDFQDFLALQVGYGITSDAIRTDGDLDDDGDVDFQDFLVLQANYGNDQDSARDGPSDLDVAAAVPEPSTLVLAVVGLLSGLIACRRCRGAR